MKLTTAQKMELANKIITVLERYTEEKNAQPAPEVLLLAFYASTEKRERQCFLPDGIK